MIRLEVFGNTYDSRERLKSFGLSWSPGTKKWCGTVTNELLETIKRFCDERNVGYTIYGDPPFTRIPSASHSRRSPKYLYSGLMMGEGRLTIDNFDMLDEVKHKNRSSRMKGKRKS